MSEGTTPSSSPTPAPAAGDPSHPRTALVLGGGSEIGAACIAALATRGLQRVHLAARRPDDAAALVERTASGLDVTTATWDATDVASHGAVFEEAASAMGRIDLVLCAVGMLGHHAGVDMGPEDVDEMVRANFAGPAAALAVAGTTLRAQGHGTIVVLSSVAGIRPRRSNYVYGSSKAGLDAFAQGLGDALHDTGVRVIVVRPGFVTSKMTTGLHPAPLATDPETVAAAVADSLGGRREVVSVPGVLGPAFGVLRNVPRRAWRTIAGDR